MAEHQRNMEHAIAGGLKRDYGEKSVNAKLTNGQAEEIRVRYSAGQASPIDNNTGRPKDGAMMTPDGLFDYERAMACLLYTSPRLDESKPRILIRESP